MTVGVVLPGLATAWLAGCAGGGGPSDSADDEVLVLAASSLTEVFTRLEEAFETDNPDIDLVTSFGGSNTLAVQVEQGAPGDVVTFADIAPMDDLVDAGLVDTPEIFATNSVTIGVPVDNPAGVTSIDDFARPELLIGACAPQVPCGGYAREVFAETGVEPSLDTEEPDVRSLIAKLAAGELDAGLVYSTDVSSSAGELAAVPLPDGAGVRAEYPIAVLAESDESVAAGRFVEFILSDAGRAVLAEAGFATP